MSDDRQPAHDFYTDMASKWYDEGHTPERWLALNWHHLMTGSPFEQRYASDELDEWMQRVRSLIAEHSGRSDDFRRAHLNWWEQRRVRREAAALAENY